MIDDNDIDNRSYGLKIWSFISNTKFMPKLNFSKRGMKRWKDSEGSSTNHSKHELIVIPSSNWVLNIWSGGNNTISNY